MAGWTESGLYAASLNQVLGSPATTFNWNSTTNKFFLTNNSDTPNYAQALAAAIYASTNECNGTGWAAGGVAVSALASGGGSIAPLLAITGPGPTVAAWEATNVSVATTTIPAAYGGYFYTTTAAANYKIIGIYFGGSGYATTAGTFAITWASGVIANITCAS
jgi:hypothetical protein